MQNELIKLVIESIRESIEINIGSQKDHSKDGLKVSEWDWIGRAHAIEGARTQSGALEK